jgi:hypothetical protein
VGIRSLRPAIDRLGLSSTHWQALVIIGHGDRNRGGLLGDQREQQQHKAGKQGQQQQIDQKDPCFWGRPQPVEPGDNRPDNRANHHCHKQDEKHLVKAVKQPETQADGSVRTSVAQTTRPKVQSDCAAIVRPDHQRARGGTISRRALGFYRRFTDPCAFAQPAQKVFFGLVGTARRTARLT